MIGRQSSNTVVRDHFLGAENVNSVSVSIVSRGLMKKNS